MTTRLPGRQPLTISFPFPHFLPTPEEDPCACESIVKFQTKVEGLLQALTRKHILSQKPLRGGGEVKRALWWRGGESLAPCVVGSGRLLLKTGWILAREAGPGFGTDKGEAETNS